MSGTIAIPPKELLEATIGGLSVLVIAGGSDGDVLTLQSDGTYAPETPSGGGIGGSTGNTDNRVLRADGTGGGTIQSSAVAIDDSGNVSGVGTLAVGGTLSVTSGNIDVSQNVRLRFFDSGPTNRGEIYMDDATDTLMIGGASGNGVSFSALSCSGTATIGQSGSLRFASRFTWSLVSDSLTINNTAGNDFAYCMSGVDKFRITYGGKAVFSIPVTIPTYTVGTLPSASAQTGAIAQVADSSVTTFRSAVAAGGANRVLVFSDGTNWLVV